jgi:outer membrane protein TolC
MTLKKICNPKYAMLTSSLLLSNCSLITPPVPPVNVSIPQEWSRFESMQLSTQNYWPYTAWWQYFNDPVLNHLMDEGLRANSTLKEADARLEQARGQLKTVQLSWIPSVSVLAGYSTNPSLGNPLGFYGVWPQYVMFNIFNNIALQKSAELEIALQKKAIEATRLVLVGQIANSYYTYIAQLNELKLTNTYINDLSEILTIQEASYKDGLTTEIQIDELISQLRNAQLKRKVIQDNLVKSANALHYLLNRNPGPIITSTDFGKINTTYPNVGALPATVLAARPDVSIAELQYRLAVQNKAKAYTSLLPSVQLDTFEGETGIDRSNSSGDLSNMGDAYVNWMINPAVFGQIDTYTAAQKAAYHAYIDVVKKALQDVDNSLSHHQTANEQYALSYNSYKALSQKYQLTLSLYKRGIISYQKTLTDKLAVDQAAIDVNQMKLMQMVSLVNLYQELGGGTRVGQTMEKNN